MHDDTLNRARHGTGKNKGDKFLALWVALMVLSRNGSDARRTIVEFFANPDLTAALNSAGEDQVLEELRDAAKLYFTTCLTDPQYSSTLFGMKRLPVEEIHAKAAHDAAKTIRVMLDSQALDGAASRLPQAVIGGFLDAMTPAGEEPLRAALARHQLAHLAP